MDMPNRFGALADQLTRQGYLRFFSPADAQTVWGLAKRCSCGGELDYRGLNRPEPGSYRAFAVCERCDLIAYEL
jgi:hypothetical protein